MTGRESIEQKAARYVSESRIRVVRIDGEQIDATARGDGDNVYAITHRRGGWRCSCAAYSRCAHLVALAWITCTQAGKAISKPKAPAVSEPDEEPANAV